MTNRFENNPNPEEEAAQIQIIADLTVQLLKKRYGMPRNALRGVHPKSHGCVHANFIVNDDLPYALKVGLFAQSGQHSALIRFSNATGVVTPDVDGGNLSRGMAIKVTGLKGDFLFRNEGANDQDFLLINTPAFAFANIPDYLRLNQILLKHDDVADMFFAPLQADVPGVTDEMKARILRSFTVVREIKSKVVANPLEVSYFSAAPFLFGPDQVVHFSAVPEGGDKPQSLPPDPDPNYLAESLASTMNSKEDVVFNFRVQIREAGEMGLGIEDATTVWADTPYLDVAKIVIPAPQPDVHSPERLEAAEQLVFSPWHALAEHQPLGSINRLRRAVYLASANRRRAHKRPGSGPRRKRRQGFRERD